MEISPSSVNVGVVLSGGGAFGAYEVGVINALCRGLSPSTNHTPLDAGVFAGTSVGAFNAAVLAMNTGGPAKSAETLNDLWLNTIPDRGDGRGNSVYRIRGDVANYLDPRLPGSPVEQLARALADAGAFGSLFARSARGFLSTHGSLLSRAASQVDLCILMDTEPFDQLVRSTIKPDLLRASKKTLSVTATSWSSGGAVNFNFPRLSDDGIWAAIRASAAIPCLFPAIQVPLEETAVSELEYFIDGGTVMNTPVTAAIEAGASEIHVISLTPDVGNITTAYSGTTFDILGRVLLATVEANIQQNVEWVKKMNDVFKILKHNKTTTQVWQMLVSDQMPSQHITVHRYHPKKALGGIAGMLNFDRSAIEDLIALGENDARAHDCDASGCVQPEPAVRTGTPPL